MIKGTDLAIGKRVQYLATEGDAGLEKIESYEDLRVVTDEPIERYCFSTDPVRTAMGVKTEQLYYLFPGKLAVRKRFVEKIISNTYIVLNIFFDYYEWGHYDEESNSWGYLSLVNNENVFVKGERIIYTKEVTPVHFFGKSALKRTRGQREYVIEDLETIGERFNIVPQMNTILEKYDKSISRFIKIGSRDFYENLIRENNPEMREILDETFLPDGFGGQISINIGILSRLSLFH